MTAKFAGILMPKSAFRGPRHELHSRALSSVLEDLQQYDSAIADIDAAIPITHSYDTWWLQLRRAALLSKAGGHDSATTRALSIVVSPEDRHYGEKAYEIARVFSLASKAAMEDARLEQSNRATLSEDYARQAIGFLRMAKDSGYLTIERKEDALSDSYFAPLRERADFRESIETQ